MMVGDASAAVIMPRLFFLVVFIVFAFISSQAQFVGALQVTSSTLFVNRQYPIGIATDPQGNVYVIWDGTFAAVLTKFNANGGIVNERTLGGITVGVFTSSHLKYEPGLNRLLMFTTLGQLYSIRTDNLEAVMIATLEGFAVSDPAVFDVLTRTTRPLTIGQGHYYDFDVFRPDNTRFSVFLTGATVGSFPFVARIDFVGSTAQGVDYIVTSSGTTAGSVEARPGIAVNNRGTVLTTMPFNLGAGGFVEGLVAFGVDFPANQARAPVFIFDQTAANAMTSRGMTTDANGNFYFATGSVAGATCGFGGAGSIVFITADLTRGECVPSGFVLTYNEDVALSPTGTTLYVTMFGLHQVVKLALNGAGNAGDAGSSQTRSPTIATRSPVFSSTPAPVVITKSPTPMLTNSAPTGLCKDGMIVIQASTQGTAFEDGWTTYPNNVRKCWVILPVSREGYHTELAFAKLDLEADYDVLTFSTISGYSFGTRTVVGRTTPILSTFQNEVTASNVIYAPDGVILLITLETDGSVTKSGFAMRAYARSASVPPPACGKLKNKAKCLKKRALCKWNGARRKCLAKI